MSQLNYNSDSIKPEAASRVANPHRWRRLAFIIAAVVTVIGLALGLGLGLGLRKGDDDEDLGEPDKGVNRTLKWTPAVGDSWQILLLKPLDLSTDLEPDVLIYDLDLFNNDAEVFQELHNRDKKVICYFSAGSWEDWRDDKDKFHDSDLGSELDGWPDEKWLKLDSENVRSIMAERIKLASDKGCDAIDPDNVDGFQNDNGLDLTAKDSIDFMKFLSLEAAKYNMSTGLKNAGDIIKQVLPYVDFSVNEQCAEHDECETFEAFIQDDKPVFRIEYPKEDLTNESEIAAVSKKRCNAAGASEFSTVLKNMNLDGWVEYCDGATYNTTMDA
ncbi:hypothetical protein jhhlp_007746 [Lomentospora prolificans]|uniref:alpha-galactosidase n=1 Tax=Lomentospora prolificans TaxID=41688 RepID=A0A2N3N0G8_9PEZI|nr:hypothetical protein jhhlp_007746 [Lomentospora prolificans]